MKETHNPQEFVLGSLGSRSSLNTRITLNEIRVVRESKETHSRRNSIDESSFSSRIVVGDSISQSSRVLAKKIERVGGIGDPVVGDAGMVDEIGADFCVIEDRGNADFLEGVFVADTGEEEEVRAADGSTREDDFLLGLDGVDLTCYIS